VRLSCILDERPDAGPNAKRPGPSLGPRPEPSEELRSSGEDLGDPGGDLVDLADLADLAVVAAAAAARSS